MQRLAVRRQLRGAVVTCAVLLAGIYLTGCGGADLSMGEEEVTTPSEPTRTPSGTSTINALADDWIDMIEAAGMGEYAQLGRELLARGNVRIVSPPELDARFNAFAHINTREIWINTPMLQRYPDVLDRATIFLHELIHIRSGEVTHGGPWWSAQSEFRAYYRDLESSAAMLDAQALHDESIGVAR
ncbi:MAG: hypothetical protein ACLFU7_14865 [Armatimonadota bacterium]